MAPPRVTFSLFFGPFSDDRVFCSFRGFFMCFSRASTLAWASREPGVNSRRLDLSIFRIPIFKSLQQATGLSGLSFRLGRCREQADSLRVSSGGKSPFSRALPADSFRLKPPKKLTSILAFRVWTSFSTNFLSTDRVAVRVTHPFSIFA